MRAERVRIETAPFLSCDGYLDHLLNEGAGDFMNQGKGDTWFVSAPGKRAI
jgi:hypothetical protein